jgi:hypothetical protein
VRGSPCVCISNPYILAVNMQFVDGASKAGTVEVSSLSASQLPAEVCDWFTALGLSQSVVVKAAEHVCSDEIGVSEIEELLELDEKDLMGVRELLPKVKVKRFNAALDLLRGGKKGGAETLPDGSGSSPRGNRKGDAAAAAVAAAAPSPVASTSVERRRLLRKSITDTNTSLLRGGAISPPRSVSQVHWVCVHTIL